MFNISWMKIKFTELPFKTLNMKVNPNILSPKRNQTYVALKCKIYFLNYVNFTKMYKKERKFVDNIYFKILCFVGDLSSRKCLVPGFTVQHRKKQKTLR